MNEQEKSTPENTDEIGTPQESESEVNAAIEQQGDDAAAGIPRDSDAAKHEKDKARDYNQQPTN